MSSRERFEAWFCAHEDGSYAPGTGNYNWNRCLAMAAWQAARAEALEEAAKVCDGAASIDEIDEEWNDACVSCAIKIRALKDKEPA